MMRTPSQRAWTIAKPVGVIAGVLGALVLVGGEHSLGGIVLGALIDGAVCGLFTWVTLGIVFWIIVKVRQ